MSVKHAVLGLVIERPGYGYELIQRLGERIEGWRPSETAVYPALKSLRAEGMIRARDVGAAGAPGSAHRGVIWYEATDVGRDEFRDWMRAPTDLVPQRDPFWLKVAFARADDLPRLVELARDLERACLERIAQLGGEAGASARLDGPGVAWREVGQEWLRRTEAAQLAAQLEAVQEVRVAMKHAIRHGGQALAPMPVPAASEPQAR